MGDTPSNYNIPNQRYQTIPHESLEIDDYQWKKTQVPPIWEDTADFDNPKLRTVSGRLWDMAPTKKQKYSPTRNNLF